MIQDREALMQAAERIRQRGIQARYVYRWCHEEYTRLMKILDAGHVDAVFKIPDTVPEGWTDE